jgi:hypothetical protein
MRRLRFGFALGPVLLAGAGCSRNEAELDRIFEARTPRPVGSDTAPQRRQRHPPGENPFGLPSGPLNAAVGDCGLVPSRAAIEQAFEQGTEEQTFVYYGATVVETGPLESRMRYLTHEQRTIPNALVVPIRRGALASRGDVVLTSRAHGSGLVRALVIGGEPISPRVTYLDPATPVEALAEPAALESALPRDSFHVVREPGEPGSTVACGEGADREALIVLKVFDERRLGIGFAGRMRVVRAESCRLLPIQSTPTPGQTAWFPLFSRFSSGRVDRFDQGLGRALISYEFAGEARKLAVGTSNLWLGPQGPW